MNVKQGDLAIVINETNPENIGIICKVLEYKGDAVGLRSRTKNSWLVESTGRKFVVYDVPSIRVFINDCALRPISGIPDTEDTDTEQPVKECA